MFFKELAAASERYQENVRLLLKRTFVLLFLKVFFMLKKMCDCF